MSPAARPPSIAPVPSRVLAELGQELARPLAWRRGGFNIPAGAAIKGIDFRLDAKVDSTSGSPKLCVQLSWNGGASWTSAKSTATLATTESTRALGSATDTWGRTWAVGDSLERQLPGSRDQRREFDLARLLARLGRGSRPLLGPTRQQSAAKFEYRGLGQGGPRPPRSEGGSVSSPRHDLFASEEAGDGNRVGKEDPAAGSHDPMPFVEHLLPIVAVVH